MTAIVPGALVRADQTQIGFVNEGGGVECLAGRFAGEALRGQLAQLVIDQRQQFIGGLRVAPSGAFQDDRELAHAGGILNSRARGHVFYRCAIGPGF